MDTLFLARSQFAFTSIFHFFFIPLTLGLSIFTAILETAYVKTGKEKYKHLTKFWGTLFLINFAVGVVTGIVMEFQFGMNWSAYSRFVGDIVGVPLATSKLSGVDALYAVVQMPGGIPVACVAIDGAKNAALLAAAIISLKDAKVRAAYKRYRKTLSEGFK